MLAAANAFAQASHDPLTTDMQLELQGHVTGFNANHANVAPWLQEMTLREDSTRSAVAKFANRKISRASDLDAGIAEWSQMISAMERLRANLIEILPNERNSLTDVLDQHIAEALLTAQAMDAVVGAVVSTVRDENRQTILRNAGILSGRTRTVPIVSAPVAQAGDWFDSVEMALDTSISWVRDDQAQGSGRDVGIDLALIGRIGDQLELGVSGTRSRYAIGGPTGLEYHSQGIDIFGQFHATDHLSLGIFANNTHVDIEDSEVFLPSLGTSIGLGDSYTRWGLGASATVSGDAAGIELGWTTSVASTNNSSLAKAFDHQNSVWVNLFDATKFWNDSLSTTLHATNFHAIKNVTDEDGRFWFVGARANLAVNDRVSIEAGYEKTLGLKDFREDRVTLSLVYGF
ncbi:MAG: hypothetical protein ACI8W8_000152 [Rhodothermales bacterium]|jgi:hypothetical protein